MERAISGLHRRRSGFALGPLGINLNQVRHILRDPRMIKAGFFVQSHIVEGDPDRNSIAREKRPIGIIQVPARSVGPRLFNQRPIVPDPHAVNPSQLSSRLTLTRIEHYTAHALVVDPEI